MITVADEIWMLNKREERQPHHVTQNQKEGELSFKVAELSPYMERLLLVRKKERCSLVCSLMSIDSYSGCKRTGIAGG